ncbi:lipopolysaccharide biosynthesis protein [Pseudoalteromonas denitrificans]|uniref:Membrane protein involved in the export of O-antigen and teichoic acid n=1 Tax=Pseudoalteromonas denitrificans DSM 6059 TaxID=1123010 RepID=A0A1I1JUR5_9GAMM|nr:oligosaccharide flippase family protein [Pseudoalteromonas denitrificans]SFC52105.1 Membrane protein involved in the export of O-antigen and teichoic acid [Pseudoalteromonas denitrificans DSM 6059]
MNLSKLASFALGPFMAAGLGLITVPLMAWLFSPEVVGQIAMFNTFLAGTALVLTLGLDQAYVREYHEVNNKPQLLRSLICLSLLVVIVFCVMVIIFNQFFAKLLFSIKENTLLISSGVALVIVANIIYRFLSLVLRMQEHGVKFSILQISSKVTLVIALLSLLFLKGKFGFITAFGFSCLSLLIASLVAMVLTRRECALALTSVFDIELIKPAVKFGFPLVISGFAYWGLISVDRWAIRYYSGLEQLGIYSVAFSFAAVMTVFQQVFSTVWAPIVYKWHKKGIDINQLSIVTDWVVVILTLVFFVVTLTSPLLTFFLPTEYADVVFLLPACMLFPVFYTLSETTVVGMNVARKTNYSIIITILPLLLNFLLCYLLIPKYAAGGAAVAVASAFCLYMTLRTEISKWVWKKFHTTKLYLISVLLLLNAFWPALTMTVMPWYVNFICLLFVLILYKHRLFNVKNDITNLKS